MAIDEVDAGLDRTRSSRRSRRVVASPGVCDACPRTLDGSAISKRTRTLIANSSFHEEAQAGGTRTAAATTAPPTAPMATRRTV
jgi:hypothetical protein